MSPKADRVHRFGDFDSRRQILLRGARLNRTRLAFDGSFSKLR